VCRHVHVADTIAAIATPPGRGGIGIVRLSGPESLAISRTICGSISAEARVAKCATFTKGNGEIIDRGIVIYFQGPASYTGEDVVELHGHGGPVVLNMILRRALALGARQARPGEFTERAYLNEKLDLLQAEAIADLIDSGSEQAARSAMRSLEGEFSAGIHQLVNELVGIRAYVEGALDFPEEEIDFLADAEVDSRIKKWQAKLEKLLLKAEQGRVLREGLQVVILGRPNAGKSSLLNRLSQFDKAIVTARPGTTRDLVEGSILIDGVAINIIDTAGIREAADEIEQEGMRRAMNASRTADLVLLMVEAGDRTAQELDALLEVLDDKQQKLVIINKIDLVDGQKAQTENKKGLKTVYLSAKTGEGLDLLLEMLKTIAGIEQHGEDVLLARARHIKALEQAGNSVLKGLGEYTANQAPELLAEELTRAQGLLNTITGEVSADDLLGEIFSQFCVGK